MKIDGADSYSYPLTTTKDYRNVKPEIKEQSTSEISAKDERSFSGMSEFEKRELPLSEKVVMEAIEKANKALIAERKFEFSIHEKTKQIMVKVIDTETNEVVREIPPEKILDMVANIWEMAGIIVDERR